MDAREFRWLEILLRALAPGQLGCRGYHSRFLKFFFIYAATVPFLDSYLFTFLWYKVVSIVILCHSKKKDIEIQRIKFSYIKGLDVIFRTVDMIYVIFC